MGTQTYFGISGWSVNGNAKDGYHLRLTCDNFRVQDKRFQYTLALGQLTPTAVGEARRALTKFMGAMGGGAGAKICTLNNTHWHQQYGVYTSTDVQLLPLLSNLSPAAKDLTWDEYRLLDDMMPEIMTDEWYDVYRKSTGTVDIQEDEDDETTETDTSLVSCAVCSEVFSLENGGYYYTKDAKGKEKDHICSEDCANAAANTFDVKGIQYRKPVQEKVA